MATKKVPAAPKYKNMMYTQQMSHLPAQTVDALTDLLEKKVKPEKYALIVHDADKSEDGTPEEAHVHAMLSFSNARHISSIARMLGDKPQYIEKWEGNARNGFSYLIHATDDAKDKYQYPISAVTANFDYPAMMQNVAKELAQGKRRTKEQLLLDGLYDGTLTRREVEEALKGSQYGRIRRQIDDVWAKRLQQQAEEWRAGMIAQGKRVTVIWVYGDAGTGKTSFAKECARKKGEPFFISGSSRDIFQGYGGEHTLILDEFRAHVIPYHDLLRITDPFGIDTNVMAPSRYNDKALACDLIIITSPYDPYDFYCEMFPGSRRRKMDTFDQLARRITLTVRMDDGNITAVRFNWKKPVYEEIPGTARPNPYSAASRGGTPADPVELYNEMLR